jgi:hypothetical protein
MGLTSANLKALDSDGSVIQVALALREFGFAAPVFAAAGFPGFPSGGLRCRVAVGGGIPVHAGVWIRGRFDPVSDGP